MRATPTHLHDASRDRGAFTLIEMLVALGVLIIALGIATTVFGITSKVTRQTAALNETNSILDAMVREIDEDLNGIDTTRSILAVTGRTQAAALTEDQRLAGRYYHVLVGDPAAPGLAMYNPANPGDPNADTFAGGSAGNYSNPRADIMMFFTQRADGSHNPALLPNTNPFQEALSRGAKTAPLRVMYGHATLAAAAGTPGNWSLTRFRHIEDVVGGGNPDPLKMSVIPANKWQLVRQAAIIEPIPYSNNGDLGFSPQTMARLWKCDSTAANENKGGYGTARSGDSAPLALTEYFRAFAPFYNSQNHKVGIAMARPYEFPKMDGTPVTIPGVQPLTSNFMTWGAPSAPLGAATTGPTYFNLVRSIMYSNLDLGWGEATASGHYWKSHCFAVAVEDPPVGLSSNLGMQRLAGCVWFQVEFLLPEDARNSAESAAVLPAVFPSGIQGDQSPGGPTYQRDDAVRWVQVPQGQTYVFVPDSVENRQLVAGALDAASAAQLSLPVRTTDFSYTVNQIGTMRQIVRMWPYAVRITIRAYDPRAQLEQPLVRTLVHRFQ